MLMFLFLSFLVAFSIHSCNFLWTNVH